MVEEERKSVICIPYSAAASIDSMKAENGPAILLIAPDADINEKLVPVETRNDQGFPVWSYGKT